MFAGPFGRPPMAKCVTARGPVGKGASPFPGFCLELGSLAVAAWVVTAAFAAASSSGLQDRMSSENGLLPAGPLLPTGIYVAFTCVNGTITLNGTTVCDDQSQHLVGWGAADGIVIWYNVLIVPHSGHSFTGWTYGGQLYCLTTCSGTPIPNPADFAESCPSGQRCAAGYVYASSGGNPTGPGEPNWAGYGVTGGRGVFSEVQGSWIQPYVNCNQSSSDVLLWAGLDGLNGGAKGTVEQGGSAAWCSGGSVTYRAWYELYPSALVNISAISVHANDTISVNVTYNSNSAEFTISVTDRGQSPYSVTGARSGANESSAECIVERAGVYGGPYANLANFSTALMGTDYTTSVGCSAVSAATQGPFSAFSTFEPVVMDDSKDVQLATPYFLSNDGTSFEVTWKHFS